MNIFSNCFHFFLFLLLLSFKFIHAFSDSFLALKLVEPIQIELKH